MFKRKHYHTTISGDIVPPVSVHDIELLCSCRVADISIC